VGSCTVEIVFTKAHGTVLLIEKPSNCQSSEYLKLLFRFHPVLIVLFGVTCPTFFGANRWVSYPHHSPSHRTNFSITYNLHTEADLTHGFEMWAGYRFGVDAWAKGLSVGGRMGYHTVSTDDKKIGGTERFDPIPVLAVIRWSGTSEETPEALFFSETGLGISLNTSRGD